MDLIRARQIVEAFTADERDVVEIEVGDLYDSFDIDRNDPEQLDHWADRHMGHHEASSVDDVAEDSCLLAGQGIGTADTSSDPPGSGPSTICLP